MKTEPDYPSRPTNASPFPGLSIRAELAARNMADIVGNLPAFHVTAQDSDLEWAADLSVRAADFLINQLNEKHEIHNSKSW